MYSKTDQLGDEKPKKKKCRFTHCMKYTRNENQICDNCIKLLNGRAKKKGESKKRKKNKEGIRYWKAKAKKYFQKWVRLRDADNKGNTFCRTCKKPLKYNRGCDGGHYVPAKETNTCFDERNCHSQCKRCNKWEMQNPETQEVYAKWIDETYGPGTAEAIRKKSRIRKKRNALELEAIAQYYKRQGIKLAKKKGLKF